MKMEGILNGIDKIVEGIIAFILAVLVIVSVASVFFRFVIQSSLVWADEFMRYAFIWMVFFSIALLLIKKEHIAVDLTSLIFPKKMRHYVYLSGELIGLTVVSILFVLSLIIVKKGMGITSVSLQIPMGYVYLCLPVGLSFTIVNYIRLIVKEWSAKHESDEEEELS